MPGAREVRRRRARAFLTAPEPPGELPWRAATYTALDLETTGLDPAASTACCPASSRPHRR